MRDGYCHCGCGGRTTIADWTDKHGRHKKGEYRKYLKGHYAKHMKQLRTDPDYAVAEDGCWIWLRGRSHGYGVTRQGDRNTGAHVWYWEQRNGPVPDGYVIHHECENPLCVNPDHLAPLSRSEHNRLHYPDNDRLIKKGDKHPNYRRWG